MQLTEWENTLQSLLRARQPGVMATSIEEQRVMASVVKTLQWMAEKGLGVRKLTRWSSVSAQEINILKPGDPATKQPEHKPLFVTLSEFVQAELREGEEADSQGKAPVRREILVLADVEEALSDVICRRTLREVLWKCRGTQQAILVVGKPFSLPEELAPEFSILPFALPTARDLEASLGGVVSAYKKAPAYKNLTIDSSVIPALARAAAGLTETEARGILGLAISRYESLNDKAVGLALREKASIVKRTNLLEYVTCAGGLNNIGGLQNLKRWILEQDDILNDADNAAAYGLRMPSGLCLTGIPGTGKSLTAQMLAAHWKLPLLVCDLGKAFSSLVGSSEANVETVLQLANAIRPCIIFFDELEKVFGSGAELDGGTSGRVTAKLLGWLQSKPDDCFVVATANYISVLEKRPELIRAGRFDLVTFCDLPDMRSRLEILAIHYRLAWEKAQATGKCLLDEHIDPAVLMPCAQSSRGFSGAELQTAMQTALRAAFNAKPRLPAPTAEMLVAAVKGMKPLSIVMKASVDALRRWCLDGRAVPAGATLENDVNDVKSLENDGLPDVLANVKI